MSELKGKATPDELEIIRRVLVLQNMVIMLEKQYADMQYSLHMLKPLYLQVTEALIVAINRDLADSRRELRRRKIKIIDDEQNDFILYVNYICRGYEERIGFTREVIKAQIQLRLTQYIRDLINRLQEGQHAADRKALERILN
ncbi:MAG: hypothetical protein C6P35_03350 [Cohnella sp.]|uniref:hypothetical protein n=1 Tax=Cohnella sp. TaxID=1883426 RepID=UPI000E383A53|nr:hypothetical protein [Cohnella sp.]REK68018.1 MAG: hypothetical protein C6P35_03350 [Cohnella sp.]